MVLENLKRDSREQSREESNLSEEELQSIKLRADLRRRRQRLKFDVINLDQPGATEKMKETYAKDLKMVLAEADGQGEAPLSKSPEKLFKKYFIDIEERIRKNAHFPNLVALLWARKAALLDFLQEDYREAFQGSREFIEKSSNIPKIVPNSLLAEAILMGISKRKIEALMLPSKEKIVEAVLKDPSLLEDYALVLPEKEREEFLRMVPRERRLEISRMLDASVAKVLHQSLVEPEKEEGEQRARVRGRLYTELKKMVTQGQASEKQIARALANAIGQLGEDARQLILDIIRDEYEERQKEEGSIKKRDFLPRVVKVFLDNFDDFRGNDIVLKLAGDAKVDRHLSFYLFGKLIDNGYLSKNIQEWRNDRSAAVAKEGGILEDELYKMEVLKGVVARLGVIPSREILEFIANDEHWGDLNLNGRFEKIKESKEEFARFESARELVKFLNADSQKAMLYYLLNGGKDRFNLINNYSFEKFKEILELANQLTLHEEPINKFGEALLRGGLSQEEAKKIVERLAKGHFPLEDEEQKNQEVAFDVSENVAVKNANLEIGRVLGKGQMGVALLFPMYREYLEKINDDFSKNFLEEARKAQTLSDRSAFIARIDQAYPDFQQRVVTELKDSWEHIVQKIALEVPLEQVFSEEHLTVKGEELIPKLDARRIDLQKMRKDWIVALKGGNQQLLKIVGDIGKKKKARSGLAAGLARQVEGSKEANSLKEKIDAIDREILALEKQKEQIGDQKVMEQFKDLPPKEREERIETLGKEILALTEKSPSAIFMYLIMQTIGEERLTENDRNLIQEMESHLQGPFQLIQDSLAYHKSTKEDKKRMRINLEYVDKLERLLYMARFADSKICCFSSSNYAMTVQHGVQNKQWVASILADPLSFVVAMEIPTSKQEREEVKDNIGFIFGSFGIDENGDLATMYNGIYYAPGIEGKEQVEAILKGVERIFKGMPIKIEAIASQHGGATGTMPDEFSNDPVELIRLRALDDGQGRPESKIYDDLGTGENLNQPHTYSGTVWHRKRV
jgi:hypothetical protein